MDRMQRTGVEQIAELVALGRGGPMQAASALEAIAKVVGDPQSASERQVQLDGEHPPIPGRVVQPIEAPTRILVVNTGVVAAAAPGNVAFPLNFQGPGSGELVGVSGAVTDNAGALDDLEKCSLRLNMNGGSEELITTGVVAGFANMGSLFRFKTMYLPIRRRMVSTDILNVFAANNDPANAIQVFLSFFFIADRDLIPDARR